jgi:hypothetical protein
MHAWLALQYVVIALVVAVSALFVARRQFPNAARRLRGALALWLVRDGRSPRMQAFGRRIAPPPRVAGDGCGTCGGCDPE